jgi:hypothetical protein
MRRLEKHSPFRISVVVMLVAIGHSALGISGSEAVRAQAQRPDWDYDWTALTVARNGAWGTASDASVLRAMARAIAACRIMSGPEGNGDCGGEITTVRAAWSLAYACGDQTFIATGVTAADARMAAIDRASELREILGGGLEPCTLLVSVDTDGKPSTLEAKREVLALPNRR